MQITGLWAYLLLEALFIVALLALAMLAQGMDESRQHKQRAEEAESTLAAQAKIHAELEKEYAIMEGKLHAASAEIQHLEESPYR